MSKETGFIKLFRQFQSWQHYQDEKTKSVFLDLLLNANFETRIWQEIEIVRGAIFTSVQKIVESTGLSTKSVRTALEKLSKTDEIIIQSSYKGMLIFIKNYEKFQNKNNLNLDEKNLKKGANKTANKTANQKNFKKCDKIGACETLENEKGQTKRQTKRQQNKKYKENKEIYILNTIYSDMNNNSNNLNNKDFLKKQCDEIIDYINLKANRRFTKNVKSYNQAIKKAIENYGFENIIKILDLKYEQWSKSQNQIMLQHYNPETLFKPQKIDKYYNEILNFKNPSQNTSNPYLKILAELKNGNSNA